MPCCPTGVQPVISPAGGISEIFRYQLQGPARHGRHAAQDAAGLGGGAQAAHRARRGRRAGAGRQDQGIPGRDRSQPHDGLRPDAAADHHRDLRRQLQCRRPHHRDRRAVGQRARPRRRGHRCEDIGNIVLTQQGGVPVLLSDVAKVQIGFTPRLGHRRPRREDRHRHRHRADAEVRAHHGRGGARARGDRTHQHRRQPAARRQDRAVLRPRRSRRRSRCRPCCTTCCSASR